MYLEIVPRTICYLLWRFFFSREHLDGALDDVRFCVLRLMIGPLLEVLGQCAILGTLPRKLKVRPLIHSEREVGMAAVSGRMRPRIPLAHMRSPATPRPPLRTAQRDAALLCSAAGFPGAAR